MFSAAKPGENNGVSSLFRASRHISIKKKLYGVVGGMAVVLASQLAILHFAMHTLSAVRAFVQGEGLWSKAQKQAVHSLHRYALTRSDSYFQAFDNFLAVPRGDRRARLELQKSNPDLAVATQGFLDGKIHSKDIPGIIDLMLRFNKVHYIAQAISVWTQGDILLNELELLGQQLRELPGSDVTRIMKVLNDIESLDRQLTELEDRFSNVLGEGSRWLENLLMVLLTIVALTVGSLGLLFAAATGRSITKSLADISSVVKRVEQGDFSRRVKVNALDEVGQLALKINQMTETLQFNIEGRKQAVSEVEERDEFMSIASHELKTPLTALSLQLQILERRIKSLMAKDNNIEPALQNSRNQTTRMAHLIDELLDLTRIRAGRFELNLEALELGSFIQDLTNRLKPVVENMGSSLSVEVTKPILGQWDRNRIEQILTNLISNAAKYGGGRPIDVGIDELDKIVRIRVHDQGMGIAPEEQHKIFERFERATSGRKISGLGLGLYITRRIIEAHGGKIWVESVLNKGSTFIVELPVVDSDVVVGIVP